MHVIFVRLCLAALVSLPTFAFASRVQPGDGPYARLRRNGTRYVYTPGARDFLPELAAYQDAIRALYDRSFDWRLDEDADLILASPNQQIANAYATVMPNVASLWYPSGAVMLEDLAESSWLLALASHETAHLYQLNAKGSLNASLKPVFGNALYVFPFVWPIFLQPNVLTPTSLVEGNAVMNESRFNLGGRLHSGEQRALVLAQIAAGDVNASRLINDQFKFPFLQTAYMQGGYFQAHLAAKYGVDRTNQFFRAQGEHYLWPLILNKTFRDHFGNSFYSEVDEYVRDLNALAVKQRGAQEESLEESTFVGPLNHDERRIWWLGTDGTRTPTLFIFDKSARTLEGDSLDLPMGKVFFDGGGAPRTSASAQHDLHRREYSLFGAGQSFDRKYAGQFVTDQRGSHTVALDARNSWTDGRVLLDGEPYDIGHSNPVLDGEGHVYYFRQNGAERLLYRDRQPLFRYGGYYGRLMEVAPDGTIYFLANSDYGSTLYQFRNREISRVVESDRVVDARRVRADTFLITEVGNRGHRTALVPSVVKAQTPAVYAYGFPSENLVPEKRMDDEQLRAEERPYSAWGNTRFSAWNLQTFFAGTTGFGADTTLDFTDPMQYHALEVGTRITALRDRDVFGRYAFTKYLPDFYAQYLYHETWFRRVDGADAWTHNQEVRLGIDLPILRWRRLDARVDFALTYKDNEPAEYARHDDGRGPSVFGLLSRAELRFEVPTSIGFYPWRELAFSFTNKLDTAERELRKKHNTSKAEIFYRHGFGREFYLSGDLQGAWAENPDVRIEYAPTPYTADIKLGRLTPGEDFAAQTAGSLTLELAKVVDVRAYSPRIPVGLDRIAPFVIAQGTALDRDPLGTRPSEIFEYGYGADFQVLLLHKLPVKARIMSAVDARDAKKKDTQFALGFRGNF